MNAVHEKLLQGRSTEYGSTEYVLSQDIYAEMGDGVLTDIIDHLDVAGIYFHRIGIRDQLRIASDKKDII